MHVKLRAYRPASIFGVVTDASGAPIAGCPMRLQSRLAELVALQFDARSGDDGSFAFRDVPPAVFSLRAYSEFAEPRKVAPSALPLRLEIAEDANVNVGTVVCGAGSRVVRGRIVDEDGVGVEGVDVLVYPKDVAWPGEIPFGLADVVAQAKTGADGQFSLPCPMGEIVLQPHPFGSLLPFSDKKRIRVPMVPVPLANVTGAVRIPDMVAPLSHACTIAIIVANNEAAIRAYHPSLETLADPQVYVAPLEQMRDERAWVKLHLDAGVTKFECDTPSKGMVLVVRRKGFSPRIVPLEIKPGEQVLRLSYP
ncbi:MAG: carboxypeptidase regulatory-like domain-containing protein [Planctomycetes bacterium]|nr:carboxypeptidase regulatory-like domain-containing protein [Planctomycetota bacterium]